MGLVRSLITSSSHVVASAQTEASAGEKIKSRVLDSMEG